VGTRQISFRPLLQYIVPAHSPKRLGFRLLLLNVISKPVPFTVIDSLLAFTLSPVRYCQKQSVKSVNEIAHYANK
jgi:hypothetical protein